MITITVYVLLVWFGSGSNQTSFAVSNIASHQDCIDLGKAMSKGKSWAQVECYPYKTIPR